LHNLAHKLPVTNNFNDDIEIFVIKLILTANNEIVD